MADLDKTLRRVKEAQSELVAAQTRHHDAEIEQQNTCQKLEAAYGTSDVEELKGILSAKENELTTRLTKVDKILAEMPQA